jgi:hypothetical protein
VLFTQNFLASTPDDPNELDLNCDGQNDFETGWIRIEALVANGTFGSTPDPPILGAVVGGPFTLEGGRLLWGEGLSPGGSYP